MNKPTKFVEILVDDWKHKAVCIKSFLKYMVKKCIPTQSSQVNFDDVSFHAHTMLGGKVGSFTHTLKDGQYSMR